MGNPINGPGQVRSDTVAPFSSGQATAAQASFRGENVIYSRDPVAALEDAAEELTFSQSETVEKKLAKRKINSKARLKSFAAEQAEKYLQAVPDLERNKKLGEFAREVLEKGAGGHTPESLRRSAERFSEDKTHQFLALSYTCERAKEEGAAPEIIVSLEAAVSELQAEAQPEIQAGLNISTVAEEFSGEGIGDVQQLRNFYRDVVLDYASVNDAYKQITQKHPDTDFVKSVNFLLRSLAADLNAGNHSMDKIQLKQIMDDMYQLKLLNGMHDQCQDLLGRVQHNFSSVSERTETDDLMKELLAAQDKGWQGEAFFSALPARLGIDGSNAQVYFLQGFKEMLRLVPLKVFQDDDIKRQRLMQSIQQALDVVINNELADG